MNKYLALILFLVFFHQARSQYFIPLQDASGMELTVEEVAQLNLMAEDLVMSLPSTYQDGFRVYDLGVYSMHNYYAGGVSAIVNQAIAETERDYSLYMWYVLTAKGEFELFAHYMFPEGEIFQCYDSEAESRIRERIEFMRLSNRNLTRFEQEKRMIGYFSSLMEQLSQCCVVGNESGCINCDVMPIDIKILMEEKEAVEFDLSMLLPSITVSDPEPYITYYGGNPEIEIEASGTTTSIYELVREYLSLDVFSLGELSAYITTDSNLCDFKVSEILSDTGSMYFLWAHVSLTYNKLWAYSGVNILLDEIDFSGCDSRQQGEGLSMPCVDAYLVVDFPLPDSIDKFMIGYWINEIFSLNGLDNITSSVTNDDSEFREWRDVWIRIPNFPKWKLEFRPKGKTEISNSGPPNNWVFHRYPSIDKEFGSIINPFRILEPTFPYNANINRSQYFALVSAHEYIHQIFAWSAVFYWIEFGLDKPFMSLGRHSDYIMSDGNDFNFDYKYNYISNEAYFARINPSEIGYIKKYFLHAAIFEYINNHFSGASISFAIKKLYNFIIKDRFVF